MRLKAIRLRWFRGAAQTVELALEGKSTVLYGANGAGKSSFVDALEYVLSDGRVGHLTHEYSGKRQEKGVINTHKPTLEPTTIDVLFADGKAARIDIQTNGNFSAGGDGLGHLQGMDYRRLVLRQDEVAAFIRSAKGEKYSALLPLLGLEQLELAAEGIRQLGRRVEREGRLEVLKSSRDELLKKVGDRFKDMGELEGAIATLHARYRGNASRAPTLRDDWVELQAAIRSRLDGFGPDVRRYEVLKRIADSELASAAEDAAKKHQALTGASVRFVQERLDVLDGARKWVMGGGGDSGRCPACGQEVSREALSAHVESERATLQKERLLYEAWKSAAERLRRVLVGVYEGVSNPEVAAWLERNQSGSAEHTTTLRKVGSVRLDGSDAQPTLVELANAALPLVVKAQAATEQPAPDTRGLLEDFQLAVAGQAYLDLAPVSIAIRAVQRTLSHLASVERKIRSDIREQADAAIAEISKDVQRMWAILHPGKEIEDVRLKHPDESDKAIDIELKFFGVDLKSPRLTLSEGNRNSLGLCVFLSMALRAPPDQPVVLDDVVVSLDREHRGMIVELLEREFSGRQVIVLTHERDWYAELVYFLDKGWQHLVLRPYAGPAVGIGLSERVAAFDDARAQIASSPDGAGNTARKIMDTQLAIIADKLRVPMEYRQGLRNEHRMAHEFLESLGKASGKAFQVKDENGDYKASADLAKVLEEADKAVLAWGNKGSHTFDVAVSEATKLIDKCEEAIKAFSCQGCGKFIGKFDDVYLAEDLRTVPVVLG